MGGAASRASNGEAYSKQAAEAKVLPDQILTLFFSNANLMKLLKLHNIGECSRFVFTTSSELATLFQKLQVYPKLGAKGEILFAPVSDLAAGLLSDADKDSSNQAKLQEKIHSRNELCVDIAYFYVRIFQIYSALALTVIDADPLRKRRFAVAQNPIYASKPQNSPLGGGARVTPPGHPIIGSGPLLVLASPGPRMQVLASPGPRMQVQQGGAAISKTGKFKDLYNSIVSTPFIALLGLSLLDTVDSNITTPQVIKLVDKRATSNFSIFFTWDSPQKVVNEYEVQGVIKRNSERNISLKASKTDESHVLFTYNDPEAGIVQQKFRRSVSGQWEFEYEDVTGEPRNSSLFFDNIYDLYGQENKKSASSSSSSSSSSGVSSISSATAFEGFEKLKTIFEDKTKKGKEFPKAYCMARLMTLINPVFSSELSDPNQPYYSQICRTKFDFETTEYMPRAGKAAKSNDYLRSFTSLYYDDYKYNRGTGKLDLTQTEPSRSSLRDASNKFAKMYNIPGDQPNFLFDSGGAVIFTPFKVCEGKGERLLRIKGDKVGKEFLATLQKECVDKMLEFQKKHTIKVNKLLMKMFKIEKAPLALKLQPAIKSGGIDAINKIGVEAHDLLMDYYLKSEAFYIRGVTLFQTNPNAYEAV
jgi:hypothetical protein